MEVPQENQRRTALSPRGESMKPIIKSMETWGLAYKSGTLPGTAEEPA